MHQAIRAGNAEIAKAISPIDICSHRRCAQLLRPCISLQRTSARCCSGGRDVLYCRRFRELMPPVGLYSESRPDGTHAWSAWDPLGPGSEILR